MAGSGGLFDPLEGRTPAMFLVGGGLLVVFAALLGVEAVTGGSAPEDVFGPAGLAFGFIGLLGLYPALVNRTPWLARAGAVFATLGVVGGVVTSVWHVGLWAAPGAIPDYASVFGIGIILGMIPGYLSFGVACLRTDVHARIVGLLMLAVPAVITVMLVSVVTALASADTAVLLASGQALAHLGIGYTLRAEGVRADRVDPTGEPT